MKLLSRSFLLLASSVAAVAVPMLAPSSASAILIGAESNGELVNSNRTPALQAIALDKMRSQGTQVVRGNWGWNEVATNACATQSLAQLEDHLNSCYDWGLFDSFVKQANDRGMQVMISITRSPGWVNLSNDPLHMGSSTAQFTNVLNHYVAFHKAVGTRYKAGSPFGVIKYYTIHNEPNSRRFWGGPPNPQRYALLYARTAVALKTVNPGAQIAPGPTGPTGGPGGMKPRKFLAAFQTYATKYLPGSMTQKRRYLNAYAHNPYPGTYTAPSISQGNPPPDAITMSTIDRLFKQLDRSPLTRGTKVWATEFGWETSDVNQRLQAQFIAEAYHWLYSKRRVTIGITYGLTDPTDPVDHQSGTFLANGQPKVSFTMFRRMVSVPQAGKTNRLRRGTAIKVWGRSNMSPRTGVLAFKRSGDRAWRIVPGQRRAADGSITATIRATAAQYQFSVYDKGNAVLGVPAGYGLTRVFRTY